MSLTSMSDRARMAEHLSIQQLQQSIQDGVLPSWIGVPLLKSKVEEAKQLQASQAAQSAGPQPSVAQQIMSQAQQVEQGVPGLQSNLPVSMAGGGIVAFAGGGMYDEDDTDEERQDAERQAEMDEMMNEYAQTFQNGIGSLPAAQEAAQPQTREGIAHGDTSDFIARIMHKESRGKRYDKDGKLLTSEKGAMGEMQVMPGTSRDPGYGVKGAQSDHPDELARVGRDYANALLQRYGDPKLAAIAYNMGPGATDKWLTAGADVSKLPKETQGYVKGFAQGGEVQHFAGGGLGDADYKNALMGVNENLPEKMPENYSGSLSDYYARRQAALKAIENARTPKGEISPESAKAYQSTYGRIPNQSSAPLTGVSGIDLGGAGSSPMNTGPAAMPNKLPPSLPKAPTNYDLASSADDQSFGPIAPSQDQGAAPATEAAAKPDRFAKYEDLFNKREANLEKQREQDKYMALLQAGFGMMGGTSPNALANIGAGASQGIQSLAQSNKDRTAEENAILSGRLGLEKIGANREYQDAMMAYRKDFAASNDARNRELANAKLEESKAMHAAGKDQKTYKLLSDIEDKIRTQVSKDVAANPVLSMKPDVETIKEQMVQDRLRQHGSYGRKYKEYHGEDPFAVAGNSGKMAPDRSSQFSVIREKP